MPFPAKMDVFHAKISGHNQIVTWLWPKDGSIVSDTSDDAPVPAGGHALDCPDQLSFGVWHSHHYNANSRSDKDFYVYGYVIPVLV